MSTTRPHTDDLQPGHLLDHDFEIQARAGRGSFSTVYRAIQRSKGNQVVAVKVLHWGIQQIVTSRNPDAANPFLKEKQLVARLTHPAVCKAYRTGRSADGRWYVVVEWVQGETLEDLLKRHRTGVSLSLGANIVQQLGAALSEMHRLRVVHRDLKPPNLMISPTTDCSDEMQLRILDFGLARLAGEEDNFDATGALLVGTPAYMSPEQANGGPVDPRSDIFSAATIMYELLTGRRPIQLSHKITTADDYVQYLVSDAPLPTIKATELRPELPEDVDDIFAHGLARERHMRTATVEMFCDDLEVVLRSNEPALPQPTLLDKARNLLKRK